MIDPDPLAHEPSDAEVARRVALLELPPDHPQRRWEPFVRHLDRPTSLTTGLLQRWVAGRPVTAVDLLTRLQGDRQYRVVSLVTPLDGDHVPLCHATAVVDLRPLPGWAREVLTRTEQPLSRVLQRAGAVRDRTTATVLDPDPDAPGDAGLHTRGAYRLPAGGRLVAAVEEWFTGYVLELQDPVGPAPRERRTSDLDTALLRVLRQRRTPTAADRARLRRLAALDGRAGGRPPRARPPVPLEHLPEQRSS
jgi:chorismate-pyruvate lyase